MTSIYICKLSAIIDNTLYNNGGNQSDYRAVWEWKNHCNAVEGSAYTCTAT